jgi:hypothetical protein
LCGELRRWSGWHRHRILCVHLRLCWSLWLPMVEIQKQPTGSANFPGFCCGSFARTGRWGKSHSSEDRSWPVVTSCRISVPLPVTAWFMAKVPRFRLTFSVQLLRSKTWCRKEVFGHPHVTSPHFRFQHIDRFLFPAGIVSTRNSTISLGMVDAANWKHIRFLTDSVCSTLSKYYMYIHDHTCTTLPF